MGMARKQTQLITVAIMALVLAACSSTPTKTSGKKPPTKITKTKPNLSLANIEASGDSREIVMYALGLLDVGYQFGGKNPEAGLDCSGMAAFIYKNAVGVSLPHNAAEIAARTRQISREKLRAGDMVFFNTMNRPYSHMGIYIGDGKFIHAPRTNSTIRVESLQNSHFAARFDGARTIFD